MKPLWIIIDGHFEGHQGHFADCYFSNASIASILFAMHNEFEGASLVIRSMTDEELAQFPEAMEYVGWYTD